MSVFDLWLPIVVSGFATHILSTIAWMLLPHHKPEWKQLPVEDEFLEWISERKVPADQYMIPFAQSPDQMNSDAYLQKQGKCKGMMVIWETPPNIAKAVGLTLAFFFIAAFVIGYLASLALLPGESFSRVIQFVTTVGLLAHCAAKFPHVFWFRRRIAMEVLDGVVYAFATGLIFALLWPAV